MKTEPPRRVLGTFTLAMMTVAAIVSLRNLPLSAEFGLASVFYFLVSALVFFLPMALVTAELATTWPQRGGSYVWVGRAFGKKWGFYALWGSWMGIIAWFPAILAFTAAMLAHLLAPLFPGLEDSKLFYFIVMIGVFWGTTFLNFLGVQTSSWISTMGVLAGTVVPGFLIIGLGLWWVGTGHESHVVWSWQALVPDFQLESMVFLAGILSGLIGVEVAAYHLREAASPQKDYPRALMMAGVLILSISILGTLAIAMVIPPKHINLISGLMQAFSVFLKAFNGLAVLPLVALLALIGSLASINTWIIGPGKGLLATAEDGFLPAFLGRTNRRGVPTGLLLFQAVVGTMLSGVFLWLDSHSAAYWVLTAFSAQFAFFEYALVFAAAIRLRYTHPHEERPYRVPGGRFMIWMLVLVGTSACLFGFSIAFIPPAQLETGDKTIYQAVLAGGFCLLSALPAVFLPNRNRSVSEALL